MSDGIRVVLYIRAEDARMLKTASHDPAIFVREIVRRALDRMKEQKVA